MSPYRSPATSIISGAAAEASDLGRILWAATLIGAWYWNLLWLIAASAKNASIALDVSFTSFLVILTVATLGEGKWGAPVDERRLRGPRIVASKVAQNPSRTKSLPAEIA